MHHLAIFLDNATSTNKNRYLFFWAMEMVSSGKIDNVHISSLIAGHTKFHPIGSSQLLGVFTRQLMCLQLTTSKSYVIGVQACMWRRVIKNWRECLGEKYSNLPGIRKFHDFLIMKSHDGKVMMKVRDWCVKGSWKPLPLHVRNVSVVGTTTTTYEPHTLSTEKLVNMVTMYGRYTPPDWHPEYLPPLSTSSTSASSSCNVLVRSSPQVPPQKCKPSKCSTPGSDGKGHKNTSKWALGHTTRAGCPLAKK